MNGKRILLILGGMWHDYDGFAGAVVPPLEAAGHRVEPTLDLDRLSGLARSDADVVVSYTSLSRHREGKDDTGPEALTEAQTDGLADWVREEGGGLLAVHAATVSGCPNPALRRLFGAVFISHPPQYSFTVYPMGKPHAVTSGVEAFSVKDEFYVQDYDPDIEIHMVAMDRSVAYPMVWSKLEGAGRVAGIAMGHSEAVWRLPQYQQLLRQAVGWVSA